MRRKLCLLVFLALVAPFALPQTAAAAKTARILVHFGKHTGAARQEALIRRVDGHRLATVHRLGTAVVRVPAAEKRRALALLRCQSGVTYAEADGIVHAFALAINDPYSISGPGGPPFWPLANPLFPDAWDLTTGDSSVIVAVVDSGVQSGHPDLGTFTAGYDFVNNDGDTADDNGHGTAVAGVIAAQGNNGIGIAGVCWKCEIMPVKVLDYSGSGTDGWVASGITWAVDHGADVINMSLGGPDSSTTLQDAVDYALEKGVVVVAAAGNDGLTTLNYPAAYSGVISVGADDASNSRYSWSDHGSWVLVDAPGCTNTTSYSGSYIVDTGTGNNFCGTSAATPFVAGLAGLARSRNFPATGSSVASAIESTAQASTISSGNSVHGLIDAPAALTSIASAPAGPVASFTPSAVSGAAPLSITFTNTSTNATSYICSFGDGTSSTATSPAHTFTATGSYNVTLVASDGSNSRLENAIITVALPKPAVSFTASKSSGPAPLSVSFTNTSSNTTSYVWSFGDDSAGSSEASPTHTFENAGTFIVTLTATGPGGTATATRTIEVSKPLPDLALSLSRKTSKLQSGYRLSSFVARLKNRGGAADGRVKVTIKLPGGASFTSVSSRGHKCAWTRSRAVCSFGTLAAGKSAKLSFVARVTRRATVKATAAGRGTETSLANNVARAKTR
jgi:subtilisin family serine protease